jgi:hypothetical protein
MAERRLVVFATDAVTRNNTQFTVGALHHGMQSRWRVGVPSTVSHDATRPIGWAWPFAIHLEPGLARLFGAMLLCEDGAERHRLLAGYVAYLEDKNKDATREHLPRLTELLKEYLDGTESVEDATVAAMVGPELARRVFPDVFEEEDADGLVPLRVLCHGKENALSPGVYRRGELALVAHSYFRRSFTRENNLNHDLLEALETAGLSKDADVRVRLDPDVVGLASSFVTPIEQQYWYGPKFSDDITKIPVGVTRHDASDRQRFYHAVSRTEFWWQSRDGEHIFEAEELRDEPTFGKQETLYGCRYVHSMVNQVAGVIHHLDGAVREYTEEGMALRLEQDIANAGRRTMYTKLWRVDGRIPLASMKTLVHHHFRDNTLVAEYLENKNIGGDDEFVAAPVENENHGGDDELVAAPVRKRCAKSRLVPHSMSRGGGVEVVLGYRALKPNFSLPAERSLVPFSYQDASGNFGCVPSEVLELEKLLRRDGHALAVPSEWRVVRYHDLYTDFPLIRHANRAARDATLASLRRFVSTWNHLGQDRCVAVNLALLTADRETTVSIAGHVSDVDDWINRPEPVPPDDPESHGSWLETAAESMSKVHARGDTRQPLALLSDDGLLFFERKQLTRSEYDLVPHNGGLLVKLRIDKNDDEFMQSLASDGLAVKLAYEIRAATCTKCGGEYRGCPCIKFVDQGVTRRITSLAIMYAFWTDRPSDGSRMTVEAPDC